VTRRFAIVAILVTLAAVGSCVLVFNPGKYGVTPAERETPLPD
jgi:hypothetical protein